MAIKATPVLVVWVFLIIETITSYFYLFLLEIQVVWKNEQCTQELILALVVVGLVLHVNCFCKPVVIVKSVTGC